MSDNFDFIREYLDKDAEERRIREEEAQLRYADRRKEKMEHRRRIETAAMDICDAVDAALNTETADNTPEQITALAAALNHATTAMHAAENYAESRPFFGPGFASGGYV